MSLNMPIHQREKQTDLEKRLKILNQQLYGKEPVATVRTTTDYRLPASPELPLRSRSEASQRGEPTTAISKTVDHSPSEAGSPKTVDDISYLKQDLAKILILSSLAIGFELVLYFSHFKFIVGSS